MDIKVHSQSSYDLLFSLNGSIKIHLIIYDVYKSIWFVICKGNLHFTGEQRSGADQSTPQPPFLYHPCWPTWNPTRNTMACL